MIRIALTGSIGMGKSTVAAMFRDAGIPVFDADAVVRRLQAEDADVIAAIGERFEGTVADGSARPRRARRRRCSDGPASSPRSRRSSIRRCMRSAPASCSPTRTARRCLFDIPLLFETHGEDAFDKVIVVSAPPEVQRERVLARPGMTEARLASILDRQMPDDGKARSRRFRDRHRRRPIHN